MKALAADDPRSLGEYRLRGRLGEGGMGRVYLGLSPAGRAVAIKVVRPELTSDTEFLRRFQQEVASARAVSGIYTAPVVATGLSDRPPWLATAYVPGPSLAQVVREHGPLPESALKPLLAGLVEALQAIHGCGVVHRDLKPANVLLAADGPRVIDFGISRADESAMTAAGAVFGTPSYMSPEQAEGRPGGQASDVFSLGCVITYAATGAPPFGEGTAASVLYRVVHTEAALDGLAPWLRELVAKCLAKDPAARPEPRTLAAAIASDGRETGPLRVSFWPKSVANLISAYQLRLEPPTAAEAPPPDEDASTTYGVPYSAGSPRSYPSTQGSPGSQDSPGSSRGLPGSPGYREQQEVPGSRGSRNGYADVQQPHSPAAGPDRPDVRAGGAGHPQPGHAAAQAPRRKRPVPVSVRDAARLMYAGAAYAVIYAICAVLISDAAGNPFASLTPRSEVVVAAISCVIQVTIWLWLAWACRRGKIWARIFSTVFLGLYSAVALVVFTKYPHYAAGIIGTVLIVVIWLIAGGSVLLLWQRQSSAFFKTAAHGSEGEGTSGG